MRLLLVEDHQPLAASLAQSLEAAGFRVDNVVTAGGAKEAMRSSTYDIVIVDLGLPDADGMTLVEGWRREKVYVPILVLTARDGTKSMVDGLNNGADDYLRKPFELGELVARLRALLRRPGQLLGLTLSEGNITFETITREVSVGGKLLWLSRLESTVLELLLRRAGRVVSKTAVQDATYSSDDEVTPNALEAVVSRLRRRLVEGGATVNVHTVRGVGYMLQATI